MRRLKWFVSLLAVAGFSLSLAGCFTTKDEYEKIRSDLERTRAQLSESNAELDKTRADLQETRNALQKAMATLRETRNDVEQRKIETQEKEESFKEAKHLWQMALERQEKENMVMKAKLAAARHEAGQIKQNLEELLHGLKKASDELDITKRANQVLRGELDKTTKENLRLQALMKDQKARLAELENREADLSRQ